MSTAAAKTTDAPHHTYKTFRLTPVQQALVMSVERLMWLRAYQWTPPALRWDEGKVKETHDVILRYVCLAAYYFEFPRGLRFTTYAIGNAGRGCYNYWGQKRSGRMLTMSSLDKKAHENDDPMANNIPARHQESDYLDWEARDLVQRVINFPELTKKERLALIVRFGIEDQIPKTLEETSKIIKVSKERVRQLSESAFYKIRKRALRIGLNLGIT